MTATVKLKKIHALFGLTKMADGHLRPLLQSSLKGLTDNATIFSKPPVDLAMYQTAITSYEAAIPAALDGSKTAVAQKNKLRDEVAKMYVQLAHYVEAACNDDMATFMLSGFQPAASSKAPLEPLAQPTIASVTQGSVTGQLKVKIGTVPKALTYHFRYAPVPGGGTPPSWTEETIAIAKPIILENLTPGTTYVFQVQARGRLGLTDWSDPVTRMVI